MTIQTFHISDILSVTTGRFVAPGKLDAVWKLLDFMTGEALFNHQIPRACDECAPELLRQHPDLADITMPEFDDEAHVWRWLAEQAARFGETREVTPLRAEDHTHINPLAELKMMRPDLPVIVVNVDGAR